MPTGVYQHKKGVHHSPATEFKKGHPSIPGSGNKKGYRPSAEAIKKQSQAMKGHIGWNTKPNKGSFKKGHIPINKGKPRPTITGERHPNWKGGITAERIKAWHSLEYKKWRKTIFERDSYTCQICQEVGGKLVAHHIKGWAEYPALRYKIDNGITLCQECHKLQPNRFRKKQRELCFG